MTVYTVYCTVYFSPNFNSCSKRLCEGIRKDDTCDSTLAIYLRYSSMDGGSQSPVVFFKICLCLFYFIIQTT